MSSIKITNDLTQQLCYTIKNTILKAILVSLVLSTATSAYAYNIALHTCSTILYNIFIKFYGLLVLHITITIP